MNKFVFFTFNDFSQDDGGTIRMQGIINALVAKDKYVTLISNCKQYGKFDNRVNHIALNYKMTKTNKKIFQTFLALCPRWGDKYIFFTLLKVVNALLYKNDIDRSSITFFEYIDNSLGYLLKRNGVIEEYVNDIHGIAPLEFTYSKNKDFKSKMMNDIKSMITSKLDRKVMLNADKLYFVSKAMKNYYEKIYPELTRKKNLILRDGTTSNLCTAKVNMQLLNELRIRYDINIKDNIILFIGDFKDFGGVLDLIEAFVILYEQKTIPNLKLLLVGNGERFNEAKKVISDKKLNENILFFGRISYTDVRTYQELTDIIVCPDKAHYFSELVPHIKYFDSLISGKIVINGAFESIKEININEKYSINFEPSNIIDLSDKMEYALNNRDNLKMKFKNNKHMICKEFTYDNAIKVLL